MYQYYLHDQGMQCNLAYYEDNFSVFTKQKKKKNQSGREREN